jgi:hypothetical protein
MKKIISFLLVTILFAFLNVIYCEVFGITVSGETIYKIGYIVLMLVWGASIKAVLDYKKKEEKEE